MGSNPASWVRIPPCPFEGDLDGDVGFVRAERGQRPNETTEKSEVNPTLSVSQAPEVEALFFRGVAQSGRALRSGRRGPRFKSGRPDCRPRMRPKWSWPGFEPVKVCRLFS